MEIIKENGKIFGVEKQEMYGVIHISKVLLGTYEDDMKLKQGAMKKIRKKPVKKK